ncbi:MAG: hypothetical protein ACOC9P_00845 [bacterium]
MPCLLEDAQTVRYFQFFDDWLLDGYRDIVRGHGRPELIHTVPNLLNADYPSVRKTPEGRYQLWYRAVRPTPVENLRPFAKSGFELPEATPLIPDQTFINALCYAESDDGLHFEPVEVPAKDPRFPQHNDIIDVPRFCWRKPHSTETLTGMYYDEHDADNTRRFKALNQKGRLFISPDGFHWTDTEVDTFRAPPHLGSPEDNHARYNHLTGQYHAGSDTDNHIRYNPETRRYQVMHRPAHWDRRVAITESEIDDPTQWGEPRVVLAPDVLDAPCPQFQGFPYFRYEDMWIGWLQHFDSAMEERVNRRKWNQKFHEELAYSHDGRYWLRTRQTFFPKPDPPAFGAGMMATRNFVDEGDHLKIYGYGSIGFGGYDAPTIRRMFDHNIESERKLLIWKLRKDGFCYLEPRAGYGVFWMRGIVPQDDEFTLNILAPYGRIRIQLSDEQNQPLPGFSFDDCEPLTGDHVAARPRWKNASLADVVGKWCRPEFELFDARLYAFRWNAHLAYTNDCVLEHL